MYVNLCYSFLIILKILVCIPNLQSICAAVIAAECAVDPKRYSKLLAAIPPEARGLVLDKISADQKTGYNVLGALHKNNPDLKIPTGVWVESIANTEHYARTYYAVCFEIFRMLALKMKRRGVIYYQKMRDT